MCCFAGMPLISDPGSGLVAAAAAAGYPVVPIAGPSAFLLALVASGLSSTRFTFVGFLPDKPKHRQQELQDLAGAPFASFVLTAKNQQNCNAYTFVALLRHLQGCSMVIADLAHTLVFYVPPHDLLDVLQDAAQVLGAERRCVVARELTKVLNSFVVADPGVVPACIFISNPPPHLTLKRSIHTEPTYDGMQVHEQLVRCSLQEAVIKYTQTPAKVFGSFIALVADQCDA